MNDYEWATADVNSSIWEGGISEYILRDGCSQPTIDFFAAKQQIFDQMLQFGQVMGIIGFVIGLTMPYLGRYIRVKYGWFAK
jgi:hypothetical protein